MSATHLLLSTSVRAHRRRYAASAVAVAICVAFVGACLALSAAMRAYLTHDTEARYAGAAAVVSTGSTAGTSYDGSLADLESRLTQAPGLGPVSRVAESYTRLRSSDVSAETVVSFVHPSPFWEPPLLSGSLPDGDGEALLSEGLARTMGVGVGQVVSLTDLDGADLSYTVTGLTQESAFTPPTLTLTEHAFTEAFPGSWVQRLLVSDAGSARSPSSQAPNPAAQERVRQAVAEALAGVDGVRVMTYDEAVRTDLEVAFSHQRQLFVLIGVFPVIAIVVGAIVVATTFQVTVTQRRREFALLRAVGATRAQVRRLVLAEAGAVGAVAAGAGLLVGVLGGAGVARAFGVSSSFARILEQVGRPAVALTWVGAALLTAVVALRPARAAAALSPVEALADVEGTEESRRRGRVLLSVVTVLLLAACAACCAVAFLVVSGEQRFLVIVLACLLLLMGTTTLGALVLPALVRGVGRPLPSVVALMARLNTSRHPGRTAATGTAVMIGASLVCAVLVGSASVEATTVGMVDARRPFDLLVDSADGEMSSDLVARVEGVDGVTASVAEHTAMATVWASDGSPLPDSDVSGYAHLIGEPDLDAVTHSHVVPPGEGEVLVGESSLWTSEDSLMVCAGDDTAGSAQAEPEGAGSDADAAGAHAPSAAPREAACTRLAVAVSPRVEAGTMLVREQVLTELMPHAGVGRMVLLLEPGADAQRVQSAIEALSPALVVGGSALERQMYLDVIAMMRSAVLGLLAASVLVAVVGVANTMSLSVAERTREIGLLRAVGLTRRQARRMVTLEAALTAAAACGCGIVVGTATGWLGTVGLPFDRVPSYELRLPWGQLLGVVAVTMAAAVLAAWWPSRRAARVSPTEALARE